MSQKLLPGKAFNRVYDNSVDAFNPQFWANESLAILEENMVIGNMIHRDFEDIVANYGDTINTRRVSEFTAQRKTNSDNVTVQDASATNVAVVLNQHIHTSFLIRDGEESKSVVSLVDEYMAPSMIAQARFVDHVLLNQVYRFLGNAYGRLGVLADTDVVDRLTGVRSILNTNKAPMMGRNIILTPTSETAFLKHGDFFSAAIIGDDGTALREAAIGRKFGIDHWTSQNASSVLTGNTTATGAVNNASGYTAGTKTMTVDVFGAAIQNGSWFTVAGDDIPQQVVSTVGGATPTSITFIPGLARAVVDDAVITSYTPGQVNQSVTPTGYALGWAKAITIDGFTVAPQVGQMVSFGTQTTVYGIIAASTTSITLDRPLDAAINDNDYVQIGPVGQYNFAFLRNAMTMVVRPLALPRPGTGALASVVNLNNLSMRATITYDGNKQGHLVTLDMLMGVQVLDTRLGAVLLG